MPLPQLKSAVDEPLGHLRMGKTQALVGKLIAQVLKLVRRKVDDQQPPARQQHAGSLTDRLRRVAQKVHHLVHDDGVGHSIGERQVVNVALTHCAWCNRARSSLARA